MPAPTQTRVLIDFAHHALDDSELDQVKALRRAYADLANAVAGIVPDGREQSAALANLEQSLFWAVAGVARHKAQQAR
jgi:hypothetical protein